MTIVTWNPTMPDAWKLVFLPLPKPGPGTSLRYGTKKQRARKVYRLRTKGTACPHKRYPGRKAVSKNR